jgi:DNA-binding NtrC family response regulator
MNLSGKHVLLVGQSFRSADALTNRLQRWGFRCRVAGSARSASGLIRSSPVHLVLSETRLPDGTGFGLLPWFTRPETFRVRKHARENGPDFSRRLGQLGGPDL